MKIDKYFIGNTVKFQLRNPSSEREAKEKLLEAAREYTKASKKTCVISEMFPIGKSSFGINVKEF